MCVIGRIVRPAALKLALSFTFVHLSIAPIAWAADSPTAVRFDGGLDDSANALTVDRLGNRYLGGQLENGAHEAEFAVIKYDANGALQWVARYSNAQHAIMAGSVSGIGVDAAGNVYAAGYVYTPVTLFTVNKDWLVVSYSPDGVERWSHRINGNANAWDAAGGVVLDAAGNVYVSGSIHDISSTLHPSWTIIKYSSGGTPLWRHTDIRDDGQYDGFSGFHIAADGNLVGVGHTLPQATLQHKIVTTKVSSGGQVLWRSVFSDSAASNDVVMDSTVDAEGNVYLTGETTATTAPEDAHVPITLKYDANGAQRFLLRGDGTGGTSVAIDGVGDVIVSGTAIREGGSAAVAATSKYDRAGVRKWSVSGVAGKIAIDSTNSYYVVSTIDSFAQADILTTKLSNDGSTAWRHRFDSTQVSTNRSGDSIAAIKTNLFDDLLVAVNTDTNAALDIVSLTYAAGSIPQQPPTSIVAPSGLTASATARTVSLRWIDNSNVETAFAVERCSRVSCTNFVQIASVGANATSFTDSTVSARTTYRYRVRATAAGVESAYSNIVSVTTPKK